MKATRRESVPNDEAVVDLAVVRPGQRYRHGWVPILPGPSSYPLRGSKLDKQVRAEIAARKAPATELTDWQRLPYSVIRGNFRQVVTYKGNEIGAATRTGNPKDDRTWKWVTGESEHLTSHEATKAIMLRHLDQMAKTPRRKRPKRAPGSGGGGVISGLIHAGGLTGITAGQFSNEVDLAYGHPPYRYRHGWIPISGIKDAKGRVQKQLVKRHAAHVARIDAILNDPAAHGIQPTDVTHGVGTYTDQRGHGRVQFTPEREKVQRQIVKTVLQRQMRQGAKAERKALFLGGLPGAGKTTSLGKIDGLDERDYVTINPDIFKEELAKRGLVPKVKGMSPMEASALAHEESSNMALMLAEAAEKRGLNIIWDITMNKASSVQKRLDPLKSAGYRTQAVFVDIKHEQSLERVAQRHYRGWAGWLADTTGKHLGQRYVPSGHVAGSKSKIGSHSANLDAFNEIKHQFHAHRLYHNSAGEMSLGGSKGRFRT